MREPELEVLADAVISAMPVAIPPASIPSRWRTGPTDCLIRPLRVAFGEMSADLARTEQQRKAMVSDVSHELRTPLNNILEPARTSPCGSRVDTNQTFIPTKEVLHMSWLASSQ
ncbi:hypothetical protein ACH347_42770 [Saccharopolyspora sp. 5N102]|uniref:hypothetical protein n=1 Tax=Saccharopolyspora sp. 5N102 TaxID=3375155 RepID=UPI0037892F8D